jgi:hypothetical protein
MSKVLEYEFQSCVTSTYKLPIYLSDSEIYYLLAGNKLDISSRSYHENSYIYYDNKVKQFKIESYGTTREGGNDFDY